MVCTLTQQLLEFGNLIKKNQFNSFISFISTAYNLHSTLSAERLTLHVIHLDLLLNKRKYSNPHLTEVISLGRHPWEKPIGFL